MDFKINWKYLLSNNPNGEIFTQIVQLNQKGKIVDMPLKYVGMHIANLYNACRVDRDIDGYRGSQAFAEWKNIVGDSYLEANNVEKNAKLILFDSITYSAFCIYKNICAMLEEIAGVTVDHTRKNWSQCTKDILGVEMLGRVTYEAFQYKKDEIQAHIDNYIEKYNELLLLLQSDFGDGFYWMLCDCLKKYTNSKLIKEYLSRQKNKGRCFATFIEGVTQNKYISFSGLVDAEDPMILKWLGKGPEPFVDVAKQICASMNAKFVPINLQTRRYHIEHSSNAVQQSLSLGDMIGLNIYINKDDYSCCERKIFGYFNDNTPHGALYVKMKLCEKCDLGLEYQKKNGSKIVLYDGLEC